MKLRFSNLLHISDQSTHHPVLPWVGVYYWTLKNASSQVSNKKFWSLKFYDQKKKKVILTLNQMISSFFFKKKRKKKEKEKRIDFNLSKSWNYKYIYIYIYIWIWYKHLLEVECKKEHINGQFCCTVQSKIKKEYRIYLFDCKGKISK